MSTVKPIVLSRAIDSVDAYEYGYRCEPMVIQPGSILEVNPAETGSKIVTETGTEGERLQLHHIIEPIDLVQFLINEAIDEAYDHYQHTRNLSPLVADPGDGYTVDAEQRIEFWIRGGRGKPPRKPVRRFKA